MRLPLEDGVKHSFKEQMLAAREEAIVEVVNRLLAGKGFDAMTVDEVAAEAGIAKASLYKHFPSKEDLAAAAVLRVLDAARDFLDTLPAAQPPLDKLRAAVRWALQARLAGHLPLLPREHSSLRAALVAHRGCMEALAAISQCLAGWIAQASEAGALNPRLPPEVLLLALYARACDPTLEFLRAGGRHADEQIVEWVLASCFEGLAARD